MQILEFRRDNCSPDCGLPGGIAITPPCVSTLCPCCPFSPECPLCLPFLPIHTCYQSLGSSRLGWVTLPGLDTPAAHSTVSSFTGQHTPEGKHRPLASAPWCPAQGEALTGHSLMAWWRHGVWWGLNRFTCKVLMGEGRWEGRRKPPPRGPGTVSETWYLSEILKDDWELSGNKGWNLLNKLREMVRKGTQRWESTEDEGRILHLSEI